MMEYQNIIKFENIQTEESYFAKSIAAGDIIHPRWQSQSLYDTQLPHTTIEFLASYQIIQVGKQKLQ